MTNNVPAARRGRPRKGEQGSALVVAIMFMAILFAITLAAAKVRVAGARDVEDQNTQQDAYWKARAGAATLEASLITDVPAAFDADVRSARAHSGDAPLPAFDQPCYSPSCPSQPVLNADGSRSSFSVGECTSLLGNIDGWAQQRGIPVAETYAAGMGVDRSRARVAVLREYSRQQMAGTSTTEQAYILEFLIDAVASEQGRVRPSGTFMLSPAQAGCETTVSLEANPTSINAGGSSTLTATYRWADTVVIKDSNGKTAATRTGLPESGTPQTVTFTVSPTTDTTYRAEATGSGGCTAISGDRTVSVVYPPPEVTAFSINPSCIDRGQAATLLFSVRWASSVTITGGGIDQTFTGSPTGVISGSIVVSPTADTTYTLTAGGPGGSSQAQTSVVVKQPQTVDSFMASTSCVLPGESVNLSWAISNAEIADINGSAVNRSGGTLTVNPTTTTTYRLNVTRTGCSGPETISRTVTIGVTPAPTASFAANPSRVELGQAASLQWTTSDATGTTVSPAPAGGSGLAGATPAAPVAGGALSVTPTQVGTYTYTLTATNAGCSTRQTQRTATVIVDPVFVPPPCPAVNSFTAAESCVLPGGSTTLQWNVTDFDTITITGGGINNTYLTGSGSLSVSPAGPTTYTLTAARNGCAPRTATVTVGVAEVPVVNAFSAAPGAIDVGQSSALQWDVSNAASVRIAGTDGSTYFPGGSSLTVSPASTTTYTITATSGGCNPQQAQAQVTVAVGPCPSIDNFGASPPDIFAGGSTTLQWNVSDAGAVFLDGAPVAAAGGLTVSPGSTTTYRLTARSRNGTCDVERLVTVNVSGCPPPQITSFTATPGSIVSGAGGMVRLAWTTSDISGTGTTVAIGPLVGGGLPASGFVDIPAPAGTTTYTLTATSGCGAQNAAQTQVQVTPPPNSGPCPEPAPGQPAASSEIDVVAQEECNVAGGCDGRGRGDGGGDYVQATGGVNVKTKYYPDGRLEFTILAHAATNPEAGVPELRRARGYLGTNLDFDMSETDLTFGTLGRSFPVTKLGDGAWTASGTLNVPGFDYGAEAVDADVSLLACGTRCFHVSNLNYQAPEPYTCGNASSACPWRHNQTFPGPLLVNTNGTIRHSGGGAGAGGVWGSVTGALPVGSLTITVLDADGRTVGTGTAAPTQNSPSSFIFSGSWRANAASPPSGGANLRVLVTIPHSRGTTTADSTAVAGFCPYP